MTRALLLATLSLVLGTAVASSPTGPSTTVVYYAPQLETKAAEVKLSPSYTTIIRTWSTIEDFYFGDAGLFTFKNRDNIFVLWPKVRSGSTDLQLLVDGRWLKFVVSVSEEDRRPREYIIKPQLPYMPPRSVDLVGASRSSRKPTKPSAPATLAAKPQRSVPVKKGSGAVTIADMRIEGSARLVAPGQASIILSLTNQGIHPVVIDPRSVVVEQGDKLVEYLMVRTPPVNQIPPTRGLTMTITAHDLKAAPVTVSFAMKKGGVRYRVHTEFFPTEHLAPARRIDVTLE